MRYRIERDAPLGPVAEVNRALITIGLWAPAAGCLLIAAMWRWPRTPRRSVKNPDGR
jgi:hypothetical protein